MNCEEVQKYLMDSLDKSLGLEHVQEIEEHLGGCALCSEELASLAACQRLVFSLPAVDPPANFTARVMAEVREAAHPPSFWERLFVPLQMKIPLQATALLLIAVLAAYVYQKEPLQQESVVAIRPERFSSKQDETDKAAPSVAQAPPVDSRTTKVAKEANPGALPQEFIDAAQSKEPEALPKPSEQKKNTESQPGTPATTLAPEQVRPPATLTPTPNSSKLSEAASPRPEKSSPSGPAQATGALAPVPQTETDSALRGAPAAGKSMLSPEPRERNVASSLDALSSGTVLPADHELAIRLKKPTRDDKGTADRLRSDRAQVERQSSTLQQEEKSLDQARERAIETGEPQTVWLMIPRNQYALLKKDLAGLGNIEMESPILANKNDTVSKSSDRIRIRVTIFPPLPSASTLPSQPSTR